MAKKVTKKKAPAKVSIVPSNLVVKIGNRTVGEVTATGTNKKFYPESWLSGGFTAKQLEDIAAEMRNAS